MPGVADAMEYHVAALLGQEHAVFWQLYPEPAADQQRQGGAFLASDPLLALVALGMDGPFDLDIITVPGITGGLEMPKQPPTVNGSVHCGVTHVDRLRHERRR